MKLHTVFITHNRLHLTKQAIASYLETVTVPYMLMVVDNNSTDGTAEWVLRQDFRAVVLNDNYYPGYAANFGWAHLAGFTGATHLQRADNDFVFLPGWCDEVERMFQNRRLGQLGLRTDEEELHAQFNVGGNNIIRRELWDKGLRYDERTWVELRGSEDTLFSPAVKKMGWRWDRVEKPCIVNIDQKDRNDPYYQKSFADRGLDIRKWA